MEVMTREVKASERKGINSKLEFCTKAICNKYNVTYTKVMYSDGPEYTINCENLSDEDREAVVREMSVLMGLCDA